MIVEVVGVVGYLVCEFSVLFKIGVVFMNKIGFLDFQFDQGVMYGWLGVFIYVNCRNIWGFNQYYFYWMMGFSGMFSCDVICGQLIGCVVVNDYYFVNRL